MKTQGSIPVSVLFFSDLEARNGFCVFECFSENLFKWLNETCLLLSGPQDLKYLFSVL